MNRRILLGMGLLGAGGTIGPSKMPQVGSTT